MFKIIKSFCLIIFLFFQISQTLNALEIKSVNVPEKMSLAGESLPLQGAGIRNKYIIDVYIGAFYAKGKITSTEQAIKALGPKRMWIRFLRDVDGDTIRQTWKEGLQSNNTEEEITQYKNLINKFIDLIDNDRTTGDIMTLDYIPGVGTELSINGKVIGSIADEHFYPMVLNVWMGGHPPSLKFQKALLNLN